MLAAKTLINLSPSLKLPNNLSLCRKSPFSLSIRNTLPQSRSFLDPTLGQLRVDILAESLPFIQKFLGKTIVVKYGGAAMKSESFQASVVNDLALLYYIGLRPILVHGDGPEINLLLQRGEAAWLKKVEKLEVDEVKAGGIWVGWFEFWVGGR